MSRGRPGRRPPCADLAEDRSALVDRALSLGRQEDLLAHLVHCSACRDEVAELRRLHAALRGPLGTDAPQGLTDRLVSIAGPEARSPLWSRPFRRTRPGRLPSPRRALRLRRTAAAVAVGATVAGVGMVGYAAAPPDTPALVADPAAEARSEFSTVLAQFPLANDALGAVLASGASALSTPTPLPTVFPATVGNRALTVDQARATMARAVAVAGNVSYSGEQAFRTRSRGRTTDARIDVESVAGTGTWSRVLDGAGAQVGAGFAPAASATRVTDSDLVRLLEHNYTLSGWSGAEAAGRPATLVQAQRNGRTAARWWVDAASGLVLAQQSFDGSEEPTMQVGFTSVTVDAARTVSEPTPVAASLPTTDTVLTLSAAPGLAAAGWRCPGSLGGLSLVRLRSSGSAAPSALHMVYSDGLATVSVFEQRGQLADAPSGSSWDPALGAYVQDGASSLASWQSGDLVFTVVTDGSTDLLAAAVASLPHEPLPERTTMTTIRAGWERILADVKG